MPLERGGIADKLGNRYEAKWVARQFLNLLNEEIRSVTVESLGDDERGVDLWIETKNGISQAHQCKSRNASKEFWSIGDLSQKGILNNLQFQLDRNPQAEFCFVSHIGSSVFNDICDFARRSIDSPCVFYQYKIKKQGKEVQKCFDEFCRHLNLDKTNESQLAQAFDYLKRTFIYVYPDSSQDLETSASFLISGSPATVLPHLLTFAAFPENLSRPIDALKLGDYLSKQGFPLKNLTHDDRIAPAINERQKRFYNSINHLLINGTLIGRKETKTVLAAIHEGKNVILSGTPGSGKTGILFELCEELRQQSIPFLPIQLDRYTPKNTAREFGKDLGLPDCPAFSLSALAGNNPSVLILDQLDAIRWTSSHAKHALDVCREIERHIQNRQKEGAKISIILSCRTFDLKNDPSIRGWLEKSKYSNFQEIIADKLSPGEIKPIYGSTFDRLDEKVKELLSSPLNLFLWSQIAESGEIPIFRTATDLMRAFWDNRREIIFKNTPVQAMELDDVVNLIVDLMERQGVISISNRTLSPFPGVKQALLSYGILNETDNRITFCHQSYLDYLVAERLLNKIETGSGNIKDWLGEKNQQTLFRREQLRQALVMLVEESKKDFFTVVKSLLESENIRFHIKHLVLEILSALPSPPRSILNYSTELIGTPDFRDHMFQTVFLGHGSYIKFMIENGLIDEWIKSEDDKTKQRALSLLASASDSIPDAVSDSLEPFFNRDDDWNKKILDALAWDVANDSEAMFSLRIKLLKSGTKYRFLHFEQLAKSHPLRCISIIEALLHCWSQDEKKRSKSRFKRWHEKEFKALKNAAELYPEEIWTQLLPHVIRLTSGAKSEYDPELEPWIRNRFHRTDGIEFERGVVELIMVAGKTIAGQSPERFITFAEKIDAQAKNHIIEEICIESYVCLHNNFADHGILWVLQDHSRFRLGDGSTETEWAPAVRLIESLSPHCSLSLFRDLENQITHYHDPRERQLAERILKYWKEGYYSHYWGKTQYFLLPALDPKRVQQKTLDLIRVLKRKFKGYSKDRFLKIRYSGMYSVSSSLTPSLHNISDRAWLDIVSKPDLKSHVDRWSKPRGQRIYETSVEHYSRSLETVAKQNPERFGKLALRFPSNIAPGYIAAIFSACYLKKPEANSTEQNLAHWQPVTAEIIESIIEKFDPGDDREAAIAFCRLITNRSEENWSDRILERIVHYAKHHPDLDPGKLNVHCDQSADEASVDVLHLNTINCVRGVAAGAIGNLIYDHPDVLEKVEDGIVALIRDSHPAVRMAAGAMLIPVLNIDKDKAVFWFEKACSSDLRVAASPALRPFYNSVIPDYIKEIGQIIKRMVDSNIDEVVKEGSTEVTARYLFYGVFKDEFEKCKIGSTVQREGVAQIAKQLICRPDLAPQCREIIADYLNDPDKEVRNQIGSLFWDESFLNTDANKSLILSFIESQTFPENQEMFIGALKDYTGSVSFLSQIIFSICDVVIQSKEDVHYGFAGDIGPLLFRLYEAAIKDEDEQMIDCCLDKLDLLFQNRIGIVSDLTKALLL